MRTKLYEATAEGSVRFVSNRRPGEVRIPNYVYDIWMPLLGATVLGVYAIYCRLEREETVKGMCLGRIASMCRVGKRRLSDINEKLRECGFIQVRLPKGQERLMHYTTEITVCDPPREAIQAIIAKYGGGHYEILSPWLCEQEPPEVPNGTADRTNGNRDAEPNGPASVATLCVEPSVVAPATQVGAQSAPCPGGYAPPLPSQEERGDNRDLPGYDVVEAESDDTSFECPTCGVRSGLGLLPRTAARCSACGRALSVRMEEKEIWKPPADHRRMRPVVTVHALLSDVPECAGFFPVRARDRNRLKSMISGEPGRAIFLEKLDWARRQFLAGAMREDQVVANALTAAGKKAIAASGPSVPTPNGFRSDVDDTRRGLRRMVNEARAKRLRPMEDGASVIEGQATLVGG